MRSEKLNNPMISCEDIPGPSLEAWREVSTLTAEEPTTDEPTKDWVAFQNDINNTVQNIIDLRKANKPLPISPDYLALQKEINDSFVDLRNELAGLHLKNPNSLEDAGNQKKPAVIGDWESFKTNIFKTLNDTIDNFKGTSPSSTDWQAFKIKIKNQVQDIKDQIVLIKKQIGDMRKNPILQEAIDNEGTWENFKADIIKSVDEILDKIKDNMPPPGDPSWETYTKNIKNQFSNFKNQLTNPQSGASSETLLMKMYPNVSHWKDATVDIDINTLSPINTNDNSDEDKKIPLYEKPTNDESREWLKFKRDLNETVDKIVKDIKNNAPPPGDPTWKDYKLKIMKQFSKFRNDIPMQSRVLLKMSQDGTVFDWMTFKSDLNQSLCELIDDKKTGRLSPGDPRWTEFRNNFNKSMDSSKYRISVLKLTLEGISRADWKNFRENLTASIKDVVQYIKDNAPPPGSPDWIEFRKDIRNRFAELRKQFDIRKSELFLKPTVDGTTDDAKIDDTSTDTKNNERNFNWVSFKADLNKTLLALIAEKKSEEVFTTWTKFRNPVNNSVKDVKNKPEEKKLLLLTNDWADFSTQINKSLADAIKLFENKTSPGDPAWETFRDSVKNNFEEVKDELAEIREEWLSKLKEDGTEAIITGFKNNLDLKTRVENLKLDPIPFDITDVDWALFKESINKTVVDYINSMNRSDPNEWEKFREFVDKSVADLQNEVDALRNETDEALKKIDKQKTDDSINNTKLKLLTSSAKRRDLIFLDRNIWIGFVSIATFVM